MSENGSDGRLIDALAGELGGSLTRRALLRGASGVALAGMLGARTALAAPKRRSAGDLVVWYLAAGANPEGDKRAFEQSMRAFERAKGAKVKGVAQTLDGFIPAWKAAVKAGQGPDLQYLWEGIFTLEDAWQGNLEPYDTHLAAQETRHWLGTASVRWNGHLWNSPRNLDSLVLLVNKKLLRQAKIDPSTPLQTWAQFLRVCKKLKSAGIGPLGFGLKDGFGGGWLFSAWARAHVDNVADYMRAVVGDADITSERYSEWWFRLAELRDKGYFNNDIGSLPLFHAVNSLFGRGRAAMVPAAASAIRPLLRQVGVGNVRVVSVWPTFGDGKLAKRNITIFSGGMVLPAFSKQKQLAAEFAAFLHRPDQLRNQYQLTTDLPADDRVSAGLIREAWQLQIYQQIKTNPGPWLEDWIPTQMDSEANFSGCQGLFAGQSAADQVKRTRDVLEKWRRQSPELRKAYRKWIGDARRVYRT